MFVHIIKTITNHDVCHCTVRILVPVTNATHIEAFAPDDSTKYQDIVPLRSHSLRSFYQLVLHISLSVPQYASWVHRWSTYWSTDTCLKPHLRTASFVLYQCQTLHIVTLHADSLSTRCQSVFFAYYESHLLFFFIISWLKSSVSCPIVINFVV